MDAGVGMSGDLDTRLLRAPRPHPARSIRLPGLGRIFFTRDPGVSTLLAREYFATELYATHRDGDGRVIHEHDLGSGLVTNIGVLSMANDYAWSAQLNLATLALANQHASGTGTTAAAATDFQCQTLAAPTTTTAVAGTQTLVSSGTAPKYQTVATINYTSTLAITEWGLFSLATLSSTTGTPFTATTATTWQDTGSAQTASSATVRGLQGTIVVPGTTAVWGLNLSNTTHVGTIPAWYNQSNGAAGSTPGATEAFSVKPVMWDHKVFTAINVNNGDSIQFTYQLTINSGG
jgi:hypothetical protein